GQGAGLSPRQTRFCAFLTAAVFRIETLVPCNALRQLPATGSCSAMRQAARSGPGARPAHFWPLRTYPAKRVDGWTRFPDTNWLTCCTAGSAVAVTRAQTTRRTGDLMTEDATPAGPDVVLGFDAAWGFAPADQTSPALAGAAGALVDVTMIDYGQQVTELRIHGVSGSDGPTMLEHPQALQVAGDTV